MGRDWSWLGGGGGGKKKSSTKSKKDIKTSPPSPSPAGNTATAAGCMSAVFNIFDSHHLQFPINHHHLHLPKAGDAQRNSLESTEEKETPCSPARKDGNLNISMDIKIKTKPQARSSSSSLTATESYSPSVKTPTLVARLMGLDLVPDNYRSSPTPSSSRSYHTNKHRHYFLQRNSVDGGTRSLPETPRISLGRRSVDVNCYEHQRSSLHIRDNINVSSERKQPGVNNVRVKEMKIHDDQENRSPRDYARQIVMQLKENVNRRRRVGTDITNKEPQSREIHESKKGSKITIITHDSSSSSPRLGLMGIPKTNKTSSLQTNRVALEPTVKVQDKSRLPTVQEEPQGTEQDKKQSKPAKKCKKLETFKSRLVKPPQTMQEEPFVRSPATTNNNNNNGLLLIQGDKSSIKKTSLSINDLISVPSLHTIKKKDSSPHKSSQSSRNRASSESLSFQSQSSSQIAPIAGGELEYITRTLRRTGIDRDTPISYAKWFSPSHPLDPSIFYFLEHFAITSSRPRNSLALQCNRKLLFHLVDEILADILKPYINLKPWVCRYPIQSRRNLKGSELVNELSRRIEKFPLAECLILEDIDSLVAGDLPETATAFEEEGEGIVTELERGILETLVTETTTDYFDTWIKTAPVKRNDDSKPAKKCKKLETFKSRLVKPPQTMQEEPFIRSPATSNSNNNGLLLIQGDKSSIKKTSLSINDLISVPSLHTIKKKDSSPHKSSQSSRNRASSDSPSFQSQSQTHIAPIAGGELEYISRTLRRTGIDRDTPISYAKWFSPSHPLDPSIFYFLEHFAITSSRPINSLALRCNRKLLFHLVDEILADILKPYINLKPWVCRYPIQSRRNLKGSELIDELSRRIEQFPLAECLVLEDVDSLVTGDIPEAATQSETALEEEGEGIVTELERGILESLVTETTTDCYDTWIKTAPVKRNDDVSGTWGVHVTRYLSNVGSHHDSASLCCDRRMTHPRG